MGAAPGRPRRRRGGRAPRHGQARRVRRPRAGRAGRHDPGRDPGGPPRPRAAARLRDGRHVRRRVRGRDARTSTRPTPRPGRAPEAPPVDATGGARHRLAGRSGSGRGSSSTTARSRRPTRSARAGWRAVMINSNPETVSTDFDASSRLYFEPLDPESVRSVIDAETRRRRRPAAGGRGVRRPDAAQPGRAAGRRRRARCSARDLEAIDQAEERTRFSALLDRLGIPQPEGGMAHSVEEALTLAERIGYPVIVRPSFVIGGLAIDFCYSPRRPRPPAGGGHGRRSRPARPHRPLPRGRRGRRRRRLATARRCSIPGLLEHVERAGVHSGDSVGMFPPQTVARATRS